MLSIIDIAIDTAISPRLLTVSQLSQQAED
jgi:hypothetical protein